MAEAVDEDGNNIFRLTESFKETFGENTVSHSDKTWISEIIADISSSEPTKKESVQDCPQVESYIKIDFQFETGTSTIFAYEDMKKQKLNYRFHNPNTAEVTADYILKVFIEVNAKKVERVMQEVAERGLEEDKQERK